MTPNTAAASSRKSTGVTPEHILQIGFGFWPAKTLLTAVELGVFTELAKGPLALDALARRLGLQGRGALDFFDALVALGLLDRQDDRYANTPETARFLDREQPSYVGGILEMANARTYGFWGSLTEALRTGQPQNETKQHQGEHFEAIYADPERMRQFARAMTGISTGAGQVIAQRFPWKPYQTFIDLGTAQGAVAAQIALAHKHLTGGGFDLPPIAPIFDEYIGSLGLAPRLRFYPGDFFKDAIPTADVLILGHILHGVSLDEKRQLLAKVYQALPRGGAVIIHEALIDDERRRNAFGLLMSLNMLIETEAGFDYTGADCQGWLREAGFSDTRVEPLTGPDSMVVGIK